MNSEQRDTAKIIRCLISAAVAQATGAIHTVQGSCAGRVRSGFVRAGAILKHRSVGPEMRNRLIAGIVSAVLLSVLSTAVAAQASNSPSNGWDNAYYQILAESLRRAGKGKWVYTADGHAIGRIADIRTSRDGLHEVAVVRVRPLMGGGQVALPIYRLARRKGRIVASDGRAAIRAMARSDMASKGRR